MVSTHSRPKAAGHRFIKRINQNQCFNSQPPEGGWVNHICYSLLFIVSTHSRPKAAGCTNVKISTFNKVSTHSRPKAAGRHKLHPLLTFLVSTHSRPKAAGAKCPAHGLPCPFQLTAARRRLDRPCKAASTCAVCFNSQPPEGGWFCADLGGRPQPCFNSQPPEGGWVINQFKQFCSRPVSTHSRPKAAGVNRPTMKQK